MARDKTIEEVIESVLNSAGVPNSGSIATAIWATLEEDAQLVYWVEDNNLIRYLYTEEERAEALTMAANANVGCRVGHLITIE